MGNKKLLAQFVAELDSIESELLVLLREPNHDHEDRTTNTNVTDIALKHLSAKLTKACNTLVDLSVSYSSVTYKAGDDEVKGSTYVSSLLRVTLMMVICKAALSRDPDLGTTVSILSELNRESGLAQQQKFLIEILQRDSTDE